MTRYFGPPWPSDFCDEAEQAETPVGQPCTRCKEPFIEGDSGVIDAGGTAFHRNCFLRLTVGSAAHNEGRCCCSIPGSTCNDDESLTRREAADAAVAAWERVQWRQLGYSFALGSDKHGKYILCDDCGLKSYHPEDMKNYYCGKCNKFHDITRGAK